MSKFISCSKQKFGDCSSVVDFISIELELQSYPTPKASILNLIRRDSHWFKKSLTWCNMICSTKIYEIKFLSRIR